MKKTFTILSLLYTFTGFCQTIYYVSTTGNDTNVGTSWSTAFKTVQKALAVSGGEIWVAKGTYYPDEGAGLTNNNRSASFNMKNNVAIYGGFAGNETNRNQRNWKTNESILSGDIQQDNEKNNNVFHVVKNNAIDSSAVLDGFTITGGNANANTDGNVDPALSGSWGGGMYNNNSSPTVANCNFFGNIANIFGGGMCNYENSSPIITHCIFSGNNAAAGHGGGLWNYISSSPIIKNCSFLGNSAASHGGGIFNDTNDYSYEGASSPTITNCIFSGNSAC